jgi:hypothetical protein
MWTEEEIASRNHEQPQILKAVLASGCATLDLLSLASEELDALGPPHIGCFAMLPFPLAVSPKDEFSIPTGRDGAVAKFRFNHFTATTNADHGIQYQPCTLDYEAECRGIGTQVVGYITLWGRHLRYYPHYLSCLSGNGLEKRNLNKSLWDKKRAPVGFEGYAINSHRYEDELNAAIVPAFAFALSVFIDNYNVSALFNFSCPKPLPGVFTMLAPGRVSYCHRPQTPFASMLQTCSITRPANTEMLSAALRFGRRQFDRYQYQLLAMQRLARDGEVELAVVGCVTAIEWFLNSLLVDSSAALGSSARKPRTLSINECLKKPLKAHLSLELQERLRSAANFRNSLVHGKPPSRKEITPLPSAETNSEIVRTGFALYREAQVQLRIGLVD